MQSNPAVSNISTAAQRSFLWAPYRLNKLPEMSFKFPINLMGKYNNSLCGRHKKGRGKGEGEREKGRERLL